jgi:SOS response regulatory protein OraA/RecX
VGEPRPAVETALRALRARDRSVSELESRLQRRGVGTTEQRETLELLSRLGYVDDERFARSRAESLARRNCGNEMIRADLEGRGVSAGFVDAALAGLAPERERVGRIVASRGRSAKTARFLAARGFSDDSVQTVVAPEEVEAVD